MRNGAGFVVELVVGYEIMVQTLACAHVSHVQAHTRVARHLGTVDARVRGSRFVTEAAARSSRAGHGRGRRRRRCRLAWEQLGADHGLVQKRRVGMRV